MVGRWSGVWNVMGKDSRSESSALAEGSVPLTDDPVHSPHSLSWLHPKWYPIPYIIHYF